MGSRYNISFCNDIKCIQCRFLQIEGDHTVLCSIDRSDSVITLTYLSVTIDGNTHLNIKREFKIVVDPLVVTLSVESTSVFRSGGTKLIITGTGFLDVGIVKVDTPDADPCTIISNTNVVCKTPPYVKSDFGRWKRAAVQNIYVHFDNYRLSIGVFYVDDPLFEKLSKVYVYVNNAVLVIKGRRLLQGARPDDYFVRVGLDGLCRILDINNNNITCLPPKTKPRTNTGDFAFIMVVVGNINEYVGNLRYDSSTSENNKKVPYGVAGGVIVVGIVVIILLVVIMFRRKIKKKMANTTTELNEIKKEISKTVAKLDGLSAGSMNLRTEFVEPNESDYAEINGEDELNRHTNRHTDLDVASGYEDLGQMSANYPYNQLQQATNESDYDDINAEDVSNRHAHRHTHLDVISGYEDLGQMSAYNPYNQLQQATEEDLNQEVANTDYLTSRRLSSNDFSESEDYMEPVDTTDANNKLKVLSVNNE
ncbi:uncharacterized protein LOC127714275 [Mytilus californianus]|uniref:uncharacterized protein LOC127714275 n=1 Tax=Mytilus californianus TaxID=6549 RepID=UPI002247B038|nr:uncharacterized protein LOC127714275 [Mytilus californianus]